MIENPMMEVKPTGQRARMITRSGQNVREAEKYVVDMLKTKRDTMTLYACRLPWLSISHNHRKGPAGHTVLELSGQYRVF